MLNPSRSGSSVSLAVSSYCRGEDVSTPVSGYETPCSSKSCFCHFTNHDYQLLVLDNRIYIFHLPALEEYLCHIDIYFLFECFCCALCGKTLSLVKLKDDSLEK